MKLRVYIFIVLLAMFNILSVYCSSDREVFAGLAPRLNFHGTRETVEKIKEIILGRQKGAYMRFGDGDIVLAYGGHDLLQVPSTYLQQEMKEAFALNHGNILKALPIHNKEIGTYEDGMFPGNHEAGLKQCVNLLKRAKPLWNADITDVYSATALHYLAVADGDYCIDFLKFMRDSNCYMFIGNENVPENIIALLWGPSCKHIKTPSKNAFSAIDRIILTPVN